MAFLDILEQNVVTEVVKRRHEEIRNQAGGDENLTDGPAQQILPTVSHNGRHATIRVADVLPVGLAQFKAPGASPALWTTKPRLKELRIELVDIDEMHRIDAEDMLKMKSPDPSVVADVVWGIADRGAALQTRNELRTEWMRWEALKGTLVVSYPNAGSITVDYGIPVGHFPTSGISWDDTVNSDPVEDLWSLGSVALDDAGVFLSKYHFTTILHRLMRKNSKVQDALSSYGRNTYLPTDTDMKDLLREGTDWTIIDGGYIPENQATFGLTKWISDAKVFATTKDYSYAGRRIGEMLDGWVLVGGNTTAQQPDAKQGMQSEWIYNRMGQQTFLRQAAARIPRIVAPEALGWLTAVH